MLKSFSVYLFVVIGLLEASSAVGQNVSVRLNSGWLDSSGFFNNDRTLGFQLESYEFEGMGCYLEYYLVHENGAIVYTSTSDRFGMLPKQNSHKLYL